ncbi:MAG: hypothetical protein ACE5JL_07515, partial [Dehalococcoidia bacterium]
IHRGRCADIDQKPQVDYLLFNIVDGESVSLVNTPTQFFQFNKAFIVVYQGETVDTPVASCGDVPSIF